MLRSRPYTGRNERSSVLAAHVEHRDVGDDELGDPTGRCAPRDGHSDHVHVGAGDKCAADGL